MTADARLDGDQLIARRDLAAPPELVWRAFTTPAHLAQFWGGHHAEVPADSVSVELRVGGWFAVGTRAPDGRTAQLRFRYDVVEPPHRLVFTEPRTGLVTEIRIEPIGTGTRTGTTVVVHQRKLPAELQTDQARIGLAGILERLDEVLRAHQIEQERLP